MALRSLDLSSWTRGLARIAVPLFVAGVAVAACSGSTQTSSFGDDTDASTTSDGGDDGTGGGDGSTDDVVLISDSSAQDSGPNDGNLFNDGAPDVNTDGQCRPGDAGAPQLPQKCAPRTANECDGATDTWLVSQGVVAALKNNAGGNGFDDDCDGLVDEGCACPGNGQTRDCYLTPSTQADPGTHVPVGWCTQNSKGSLDCAGTEFPKWSGTCRGAQPPYAHDICAPGDFNCDGVDQNSDVQDCRCMGAEVTCPTMPIVEAPYPNPAAIQIIDGSQWVSPGGRAQTTNWTWTVIGGDCDNVLPHPTYAIYNNTVSTTANARKGVRTPVKFDPNANPARYVSAPTEKLISVQAANYGSGVAGGQIYPAFGLSGDYIVQGEFDVFGKHYVCTQKVQVRAPGIRAELCWDTQGGQNGGGNDIDLHMARLQGVSGCAAKGWETTCTGTGGKYQDCWYNPASGCRDFSTPGPGWGYADSAQPACIGWSSKRTGGVACTNPRLDKDNISCTQTIDDPTDASFCGPENINLDNPNDGDAFVVGVNHYGNGTGSSSAKSHVNLYCNGKRVISVGYDPVGGTNFPVLTSPGASLTGDEWTVGTIVAHVAGGQITSCDVATIPSHNADPGRDGSLSLCVDSKTSAAVPPWNYTSHQFVDHTALQGVANGTQPTSPAQWCKH